METSETERSAVLPVPLLPQLSMLRSAGGSTCLGTEKEDIFCTYFNFHKDRFTFAFNMPSLIGDKGLTLHKGCFQDRVDCLQQVGKLSVAKPGAISMTLGPPARLRRTTSRHVPTRLLLLWERRADTAPAPPPPRPPPEGAEARRARSHCPQRPARSPRARATVRPHGPTAPRPHGEVPQDLENCPEPLRRRLREGRSAARLLPPGDRPLRARARVRKRAPALGGACERPRGGLGAGSGRAWASLPAAAAAAAAAPTPARARERREPSRDDASPPDGAREPLRGLREQLRAAAALSRRYWALLRCRVWPDDCERDAEAPPGWSLPLLGQQYLAILTSWYCSFQDCCDSEDCRISNNFTGLESDLSIRLHGQHLARELVLTAVKGYLELPRPDKALALSFHGWSGTGKNFVARLLAENLYRDGQRSDCVKMFIATFHFPHPKYVDLYKEQLTTQIKKTQERCHQTLFIFDEAEKLHPGLLEVLRPHLEHQAPENHRAKSRKTIFLFLSNLGGNIVNEAVLNLLQAGGSREEIKLEHLVPRLRAEIEQSTDSGFGHSCLVKENLIDFFVPFLPLEYRHVRLCARDAFLSQELLYTEEALDQIAKMMVYVPKEEQLFSSQGCKSISQRINYFLP
ncbi:torsin-3A isoform X3 [Canis lupus familiaris]|uniref:torsin-3A isoform X3 n=1 Tax=Canis lupus familiaris TaxID=9615 RepID=UPI0018F5A977|nr:torsin-3A isoform X3 [Canis lupus familiaris]